jgi:hypothetical protein
MLCRQTPQNKDKYYATKDMNLIHELMLNGVYPLYSDGTTFYFVRTGKFEKYMSMIRHKSLGKEESDAIKAM